MKSLREARKASGLTQAEFAAEVGVSIPTVSEWESGKKNPSLDNEKKIRTLLKIPENTILFDRSRNSYKILKSREHIVPIYPSNKINDIKEIYDALETISQTLDYINNMARSLDMLTDGASLEIRKRLAEATSSGIISVTDLITTYIDAVKGAVAALAHRVENESQKED